MNLPAPFTEYTRALLGNEEYEKLFENSKTTVENLVNDLLTEISKFKQDISSRNKYINELLKNEKKLNKERIQAKRLKKCPIFCRNHNFTPSHCITTTHSFGWQIP